MKNIKIHTILLLVAGLLLLATSAHAQVPQLINYQGVLKDSFGSPINGTVNLTFAIYSVSSGGTALWSETQTSVQVTNGLFNVLLGSMSALPTSLFDGSDRWLGVKVGSDAEMTPRQKLVSVGYAMKSKDADTLGAGILTTDKTSGNVGIGTTNPVAVLDIQRSNTNLLAHLTYSANDANGVAYRFRKSRGSTNSPLIVSSGDITGSFVMQGYDGSAYRNLARVGADVDGTPGLNDMPGRLTFHTTPDGSSILTEKMRINSAGNVGIGTTSPTQKLHVAGSVLATSYLTSSSREVKKKITSLDQKDYQDILEQINGLQMVRFLYKNEKDRHPHLGVIAEDSPQEILDQTGKAVSLSDYASFLLAGLKAQSQEIKDLKAKIDALEAQVAK